MRNQAFKTIAMLSLLLMLAAVSVNAQNLSEKLIEVNIPFDFAIGETNLPAGKYTLRRIISTSSGDQLLIQNAEARVYMRTGITRPNRASGIQQKSKLAFNRYGDQYFLSQVWMAGSDTGRDLFKSRKERNLAKESKLARSKTKDNKVTLTASKQ
jgi:Tfp pilus assembly protein PilW